MDRQIENNGTGSSARALERLATRVARQAQCENNAMRMMMGSGTPSISKRMERMAVSER